MSDQRTICQKCGLDLKLPMGWKVGRRESCSRCQSDLHSCMNCKFYDPKSYNECREPAADRVQEKDRSNFCDFFDFQRGERAQGSAEDKLKAAAEALFKKT